jgi:diadenosine tetraphosphate (Ap4A) HIT family hydrolase
MMDSIFTKIINGEVFQEIVFQDEQCVVMLTHDPLSPGHCLVVPRQQVDHLWDVEDGLYQHLQIVARDMARKLKHIYGYERIGSIVEGYGVPHAHIHIFGLAKGLEATLVDHSAHGEIAPPEQLKTEADKLRA